MRRGRNGEGPKVPWHRGLTATRGRGIPSGQSVKIYAMAKATKSHHVVPAIDGGWIVKKAGSDRASKLFPTKAAAESWGRMQSIKDRSELVIHRRDGTIAQKDSHGKELNSPRDRKK